MKIIEKLKRSSFGKKVLLIAGGTAVAQILNAMASPIITRIFSPEEYGILTAFITVLGIISLNGFKYEVAIPISKDDETAINVLGLSIIVLLLYVSVLFTILVFLGEAIFSLFNFNELVDFLYLLPIGVFLLGLYQILRQWSFRKKDFKTIAKTTVNQSVYGNIMKIVFGLSGLGSIGLILGNIVKDSAGVFTIAKPLLMKEKKLIRKIKLAKIIETMKRYKNFPLYNLPSHFFSNLATKLPVIFLTIMYGTYVVGLFGLASTIVRIPMRLIGASVGDVFFTEAASIGMKDPKKLKKLSNNLIVKLILIGLVPLLLLLTSGPQLFALVFGDNWYEAGIYAQITSVMLFFILIFAPISRVYEVYEKQKIRFAIEIIKVILVVLVFLISWLLDLSPYISVLLYSIVMSLIHLLIYLVAQKIMNNEIKRVDNE